MACTACMLWRRKILIYPYKYYKALKEFAESIHAIDDRLDTMPPADILAAGEARLGIVPSEFLGNPKIFSSREYKLAEEMRNLGFLSKEEGIAFANLASVLVKEETAHLVNYQKSHSPGDRNAMLDSDRKITEALVAAIVHGLTEARPFTMRLKQTTRSVITIF